MVFQHEYTPINCLIIQNVFLRMIMLGRVQKLRRVKFSKLAFLNPRKGRYSSHLKSRITDSSVDFRSEGPFGAFCQKGHAQTILISIPDQKKIVGAYSVRRPSSPPGEILIMGR